MPKPDREDIVTAHLHIAGRVQGVGYRAWTVHTARGFGLSGWVRNLTDGSVEALAQGPREAVQNLVAAAHAGPPGARVTEVRTANVDGAPLLEGFSQRPTAQPGTAH